MKKKPIKKEAGADPTGAAVSGEAAKAKPFANCRPRAEWKHPIRRVRGRVKFEVLVGLNKDGTEDYRLFTAELSVKGLRVHRERARRTSDKLWPLESLVNGVNRTGQMELITVKGKP